MSSIILFDNNDSNNIFLRKYFDRVILSPSIKPLPFAWLMGVIKAIWNSKQKDQIICWYDFQAIMLYWWCRLLFQKRKIVCLNLLFKPKSSLFNRIVSFLYKRALDSSCVTKTITSKDYGLLLNNYFGRNYEYYLLHDVYHTHYRVNSSFHIAPNSVFCGGRNGRDWDFIIKVAINMPDVKFNIIAPERVYKQYHDVVGNNINLMTNVPYEVFMQTLCQSQITALPLDTEAPAGLIVLFQAAANNKFILTTNTATTREYVSEDRGCLLDNNLESWINGIRAALSNPKDAETKALRMKSYLEHECSEERFINTLKEILTSNDKKNN